MILTDLLAIVGWGMMCNVWTVLLWMQHRAQKMGVIIEPHPPCNNVERTRVAVVVPARNESASIGACLESILAQEAVEMQVVVVDDRSNDDTAEIVEQYAARDSRVQLTKIHTLADGWLGKSHALWHGTRDLQADWFLFLDADCRLLTSVAIDNALQEAKKRDAAVLTLWPRHAAGGFWEAMLIPLCGAIMALWFSRTNAATGPAFANGQFLMIQRADYEKIGGHQAVRRAVIEDIPFAEAARRDGLRVWAGGGRDLVSVRMYNSASGVFHGWSRIFVGALRSPLKIALSAGWLLVGSLLPIVIGPMLAVKMIGVWPNVDSTTFALSSLCAMHLMLLTLVSYRFWGLGHCDRRYLWLYPLSVVGVLVILADAWWCMAVRRRMGWRSTSYRFNRDAMIVD